MFVIQVTIEHLISLFFETESHVTQASLQLNVQWRMTLNSDPAVSSSLVLGLDNRCAPSWLILSSAGDQALGVMAAYQTLYYPTEPYLQPLLSF